MDVSVDADDDLTQDQLKAKYEASRASAAKVHVPGANADRSGFEDVISDQTKKRAKKDERKGKEKAEKFKF